jgi:hypothetical protein
VIGWSLHGGFLLGGALTLGFLLVLAGAPRSLPRRVSISRALRVGCADRGALLGDRAQLGERAPRPLTLSLARRRGAAKPRAGRERCPARDSHDAPERAAQQSVNCRTGVLRICLDAVAYVRFHSTGPRRTVDIGRKSLVGKGCGAHEFDRRPMWSASRGVSATVGRHADLRSYT